MNCPNCNSQNREDAKFCNNCGSPLSLQCPNCGTTNRASARFCDNCGFNLKEAGSQKFEPREPAEAGEQETGREMPGLQQYIPKELLAKLEAAHQKGSMLGERRIVTILFCDVKGSTAAAEGFDPEEWADIMNAAFQYLIAPVYRYEGTLARLMGDAILAFFGAPIAHEDDPQRAVLAGLEILQDIQPYREEVRRRWGIDFSVRIGINTGLVVVGEVGSDLRLEYTAMGDAVNLAARMEQTAQPNTVQISEQTYKLVAPLFEIQPLGETAIKGKSNLVQAYQVLAPKATPGRLRGIEGLEAPLIGREQQVARINKALEMLPQGVGGILCLIGEAGLGKSRLILEARKTFDAFGEFEGKWYETNSHSYESNHPYGLFQRLLRRAMDVSRHVPVDVLQEKIEKLQSAFPEALGEMERQVFETLLGLEHPSGEAPLEGETFKRMLFEVMAKFWFSVARRGPVVLVFDDLHWSDAASVEMLLHLFQLTEQAPLFLICAFRPDRQVPGWQAKTTAESEYPHRYVEISLEPLNPEESSTLVESLLAVADLPPALEESILTKAEGNPFFVEEVVRSLIEDGTILRDNEHNRWVAAQVGDSIEIPETLQALMVARIDRLEEDARQTLQIAAVVGRSFYYRVLDHIAGLAQQLNQQLIYLQRTGLIREATRLPELEYIFRHALTQEAVYNTILLKNRREFHRKVGAALETLYPEQREEIAPVLGRHFVEAADFRRAVDYFTLAGDVAFRLYAISEAVDHYGQALKHARKIDAIDGEALIYLYSRYGRSLELQSSFTEALQVYRDLEEQARQRMDQKMELAALLNQATVFAIPSPAQEADQARSYGERALSLSRALNDRQSEAKALWVLLLANMYSGYMETGIPYGEKSTELARELGEKEQLAFALQDLSLPFMAVGDLRKSRIALDEARALWEEIGNLPMLVENYSNSILERILSGAFEDSVALSEEAIQLSNRIKNERGHVNSRMFISLIFTARGEIDRSLENIRAIVPLAKKAGHPGGSLALVKLAFLYEHLGAPGKAIRAAEEAVEASATFLPFQSYTLAALARFYVRTGDLAQAKGLLAKAEVLHSNTLLEIDIVIELVNIEYLLNMVEFGQAEKRLDELIELQHRAGARFYLADTLALKADLLTRINRIEEARATLEEAVNIAEEIGIKIPGWLILVDLAQLEARLGNQTEAERRLERAMEIVEEIAAQIHDPELEKNFRRLVAEKTEDLNIKIEASEIMNPRRTDL
jgi:class 3 adenylate cyclase/tetratricopeptide (TPR) repeat protein